MTQELWEQIRANHVNGNLHDARKQLYTLSKHKMLKVILAALFDYRASCEPHTSNGALTDIIEIIRGIELYEKF